MESIWACPLVFSAIALKDLIFLFAAILLERKLVFMSKNIHLLTATLSVIKNLTKPFKYPFPLIYNLPHVLMIYCDAPGAELIGINQNEEFLLQEKLHKDYPSCIFVCLDEEKVYYEDMIKVPLPYFNNVEKSLL
mmetsp:Transcript_20831/g.18215  ORF Transcript_20831/g.18215 Transcript_20831/m.18215 type:complete len:135 (-) Transcript_20831:391-795(-)